MSVKFYQYPKCSTCVKARKFLEKKAVQFTSIDITEKPPSKKELQFMLKQYGGEVKKLFNTSGVQYRELNIKDKLPQMTAKQAIDLLASNGKLVKRPFLITESLGRVGFKLEDWKQL